MNDIPRLGVTKTKPKIGEIRLTIDGKRRKVFDGRCWQYLCVGDVNCRIQSKFVCRFHKHLVQPSTPSEKLRTEQVNGHKPGDVQNLPNGDRRVWRGGRWYSLCRTANCSMRAREFCKTHQSQRMSLPNTTQSTGQSVRSTTRARSCTLTGEKTEKKEHEEAEAPSTAPLEVPDSLSQPSEENIFETVTASPPEKPELHTRNGRRVRCNRLIWKHLYAEKKKNDFYRRKYPRHSVPTKKPALVKDTQPEDPNITVPLPSDITDTTVQTSPITQMKNSNKRKLPSDASSREHIVPKRRTLSRRQKDCEKPIVLHIEPNSPRATDADNSMKDQSLEEPTEDEPEISFAAKPNRLNSSQQSIEIPVQPSTPPLAYDSSPASILEQFGTIIKKEAVVEEEPLIFVPTNYITGNESACETLQDFLRAEEVKKKEFKLDCQRISYRLAKIQDCIGSISSLAS